MDRIIKLEPSNQVVIRIEPGRRRCGALTLRNVMHTMPVAFRLLPRALNHASFTIRPQTGIIAPLSTLRIEITHRRKPPSSPLVLDSVPPPGDSFYLESVICAGATSSALDAVPANWFDGKKKQVFTDYNIRVFFVGSPVLARLIDGGETEKAREVLNQSGADWRAADSTDAQGRTLLHLAIDRGRADLVQLLLEFNADVEEPFQGRSPLEAAAAKGHTFIAELLLKRGASTKQSQPSAYGPLHLAAGGGHSKLLRLLMLNGAEVDAAAKDRRTALHLAVANKRRDCAEILLDNGARADSRGDGGNTALHLAAAAGDEATARLLISRGCAGIREARNGAGKTARDLADERDLRFFDLTRADERLLAAAKRGDAVALAREIEIGAAVDARDGRGWTALMMAAFKGWVEAIRFLVGKGAEIDARDEEGYTALHCAAEAGRGEAVAALLKRGANAEVRTGKGKRAAEIAGVFGYVEIMRMLVRGGAAEVREREGMAEELKPLPDEKKKKGNKIAGGMRAGFADRRSRWLWAPTRDGDIT